MSYTDIRILRKNFTAVINANALSTQDVLLRLAVFPTQENQVHKDEESLVVFEFLHPEDNCWITAVVLARTEGQNFQTRFLIESGEEISLDPYRYMPQTGAALVNLHMVFKDCNRLMKVDSVLSGLTFDEVRAEILNIKRFVTDF